MRADALLALDEQPGPWVSVYLDASRGSNYPAEAIDLRWRAATEDLDAPQSVLNSLHDALLADRTPGPHGLALFSGGGPVMAEPLPVPPDVPVAVAGALPHVTPLVQQLGERVSWLKVVLDRTGADIEYAESGQAIRTAEVTGHESFPLRKVKPGGWSAPRYQAAAEVNWERNAGDVAQAATELAEQVRPEVLVVAGDVRARQFFIEQLPKVWRARTVDTETGSRAPGADQHGLDEATHAAVSAVVATRIQEAIGSFHAQLARNDAVIGLDAAIAQLRQGTGEMLLLDLASLGDAQVWTGPEPGHLALVADELVALGVAAPQQVRADDALIWTALRSGAEVYLVDPGTADLRDGVGVTRRGVSVTSTAAQPPR